MKKQLTTREKVLMCILAVLMVVCVYNFLFYTPTITEITSLQSDSLAIDDQMVMVEAQVKKMNQMKKELEAIEAGEMGDVKEIPAFDNSQNVMNSLSFILSSADQYSVNFSSVEKEESTVRRNIRLSYSCKDYNTAKSILSQIYSGEYRCLLKDINISNSGDSYSVSVQITYFEYNK